MSQNVARYPVPRVRRAAASFAAGWNRIGDQTAFYVKSIVSCRDAVLYYKGEIARLIAQMSLGVGALAVIGGTVVIIILLTGSVGGLVAIQGYTSLGSIGVEALTGFFSAYVQVRFSTPAIAAIGLAVTVGAGATAQLGAMRINEEIDALETMGVPSVPFLVTTRMVAALLVLPLMYVLALATSFFASWVVQRYQIGLVSNGVYFSYFWRFTNLTDFGYSLIKAVIFAFLVICVGVYYGYHVKGGAVGIGRAVAKTMAISLVMIVVVNAILTQIFWGTNPNLPIPS